MFGSSPVLFLLAILPQAPGTAGDPRQTAPPQPPPAVIGDTAKARTSIGLARTYLRWNQFATARQSLEAAIAAVPGGSPLGAEARGLLDSSFALETTQKVNLNKASLDEAERLLADEKYDAASQIIAGVVKDTDDPVVVERATSLWAKSHPGTLKRIVSKGWAVLFGGLEWAIGIVGVLLLMWILYGLLSLVKGVLHGRKEKRTWKVYDIADATSTGASGLVLDAFARWNTASALGVTGGRITLGLLTFEELATPTVRVAIVTSPQVDLTTALDGIPAVAGVAPSTLAKGVTVVQQWLRFRAPWIRGAVTVAGSKLVIRLTRQGNRSVPAIVTAFADAASPEAAAAAAEEVVAKMYYLIGKDSSVAEADAAVLVEQGVALMRQYLIGVDASSLPEASKRFAEARSKAPTFAEAQLYEGVALDLLEQHDEAIQRFSFLRKQAADRKDEVNRQKALYNEAIARFRKYQRPEFANAAQLLDDLITRTPDFGASPIQAFALAAKANVYAHYLIFWDGIPDAPRKTDDPDEIAKRKAVRRDEVQAWLVEIGKWTEQLEKVNTSGGVWDATARQQLTWAIHNARGNAYLNYATRYLALPLPPGSLPDVGGLSGPTLGDLQKPEERQELADFRQACLEEAQNHFQKCAQLFPPGVEALTNLATVASELGKFSEAREYARRAIVLNPRYEYAYYRLAGTWQKQNRPDKVVEVLQLFKKQRPPQIGEFLEMFKEHYVRPADE